jgi:8-oxo-dGTP pyrophosphatase MutT (NUDIX family)
MKSLLQFFGKIAFFCAWPAFKVYFGRGYGRSRIVLVSQGEVLAVKNWVSDGLWSLPGGGLHPNEKTEEGALRELREETGVALQPGQLTYLGEAEYTRYGLTFHFHVFGMLTAKVATKKQVIEIAEMRWLPVADLNERNAGADLLLSLDAARRAKLIQ